MRTRKGGKANEKEKIEKSKTSFYINKLTLDSIRDVSESYKISQGDIINMAPSLFKRIAQRSLERREESLATLRILDKQIQSSIEAMKSAAPHLSEALEGTAQLTTKLIELEEEAIRNKVIGRIVPEYTGNQDDPILDTLYRFGLINETKPYETDIKEFIGE